MVLFINSGDTSRHTASANTAIYPNLGLLTLMSSLHEISGGSVSVGYLDGTVYKNSMIDTYIGDNIEQISILCFSVLTSNYGISVEIAKRAKRLKPKVIIIFGNDHFSALYSSIMKNQPAIDYGFFGNDVVLGFTDFVIDNLYGTVKQLDSYAGLIYREGNQIKKNEENSNEYSHLPLVDYKLVDSILPHQEKYFVGQNQTYHFMRNRGLHSQVIDIGRGCLKFSGKRIEDVPINACDFCGIIPGSKAVVMPAYDRAWSIIKNAYDQGFNYLYVTADELPLTMWNLLKRMVDNMPDWYQELPFEQRPKMFGYARAEGFITEEDKVNTLINKLGFDHFFIGFDGLSDISLRVMNKQPIKNNSDDLMEYNKAALEKLSNSGCLVTAGIVVTHLGITKNILKENFKQLEKFVTDHPSVFAALDFGPLCPIPGSQSFMYFTNPDFAQKRADEFGLRINYKFLESVRHKYSTTDVFEMDELVDDFIAGCCPDVSHSLIEEYMSRITELAIKNNIVVGGGV